MGNTQTGEVKQGKAGKSPGKIKGLKKLRGKKNKQGEIQFTGIVPQETETEAMIENLKIGNEDLIDDEIETKDDEEDTEKPESEVQDSLTLEQSKATDSWYSTEEALPKIATPSSVISSESNFVDASQFPQELQQNSKADIGNVDTPDNFLHNLTLNSFKLNEYRIKHEEEKNKKLNKLGVSKTSQISLKSDPRDCFETSEVQVVRKMDEGQGDGWNVVHIVKRMSEANLNETGPPEYKRHMSVPEDVTAKTPCPESGVLKTVTSLSLSKADLDTKITKPKFVPEKLDFQLYEKFEGHMLINWYVSELGENHPLGKTLSEQELKLLAAQFCTHLLAAGVLRQLRDKDVPMYNVFKPDCMYYWAYAELPPSVPQTPGRISMVSWPPNSPSPSEAFNKTIPSDTILSSTPRTPDEHLERQESPENDEKSPSFKKSEFRSSARDVEVLGLEEEIERLRQEVEKYKTLVEIQTLTANAVKDFGSPIDETTTFQSICDNSYNDNNIRESRRVQLSQESSQMRNEQQNQSAQTATTHYNLIDATCQTEVGFNHSLDFRISESRNQSKFNSDTEGNEIVGFPTTNETEPRICGPCVLPRCCSSNTSLPATKEPSPNIKPVIVTSPQRTSIVLVSSSTPVTCVSMLPPAPNVFSIVTSVTPPLPPPMPIILGPPPTPLSQKNLLVNLPLIPCSEVQTTSGGGRTSTLPMSETDMLPVLRPISYVGGPPAKLQETYIIPVPPPIPQMDFQPLLPRAAVCGIPSPSSNHMIIVPPPPPPPMPGGPPLPPPMPGNSGPPPPPLEGLRGPPPPPMPGLCGPAATTPGGPPPPPLPTQGKGEGFKGPTPLPTPPPGGWSAQKAALRKNPLNPKAPMKPLYWTRIIAPAISPETPDLPIPALWNEIDELSTDTLDEFSELFSRQIVTRRPSVAKKVEQKAKVEAVKLLDSKRSQNVGILAQSLHVDFQEIENAVYNFDTSIVSLEALQQIYEARGTLDEIALIKNHLATKPDVPLDKPESFLHELSEISNFAERISCLMFMVEFEDSINTISHTLTNIKTTCEYLITGKELKKVMAIILTLGNYMNGGNVTRGQADGFGLEILGKLKDVKSKDSKITLLHYIVRMYLKSVESPYDLKMNLPIPQPEDIRRAASVNFDDVNIDLQKLQKQLEGCEQKTTKVIEASHPDNLQPFKDKMSTFLEHSKKQLSQEHENLEECRSKFSQTMKFYLFKPKTGTLETFPPNSFFELWLSFCIDFKDIFKKEIIRMETEKIQELKKKENELKSSMVKTKERQNGLRAKVKRYQEKLS